MIIVVVNDKISYEKPFQKIKVGDKVCYYISDLNEEFYTFNEEPVYDTITEVVRNNDYIIMVKTENYSFDYIDYMHGYFNVV